MSETEVVRQAMKALPVLYPGSRWVRINCGRRGGISFTSESVPDLIGIQRFGMGAVAEVKTATGRLTPEQHACLLDVGRRGALSILYTPEEIYNWDEIPAKHLPRGAA